MGLANPCASLTLCGTALYGTASQGGAYGDGGVFSFPLSGGATTAVAAATPANVLEAVRAIEEDIATVQAVSIVCLSADAVKRASRRKDRGIRRLTYLLRRCDSVRRIVSSTASRRLPKSSARNRSTK